MIRHSSSFLISLILHFALVIVIFYTYKAVTHKEVVKEKKVKIMLCSLPQVKKEVNIKPKNETKKLIPEIKRETLKPKVEPKVIKALTPPKKQIEKPKPKPLPKPKVKKKIKPVEKKVVIPEPEIKKTIEKEPVPLKEEVLKTEEPIQTLPSQNTPMLEKPTESLEAKKVRLEQEYISEHIKKISKLLSENLYYPRSARKRNIQGKVMVKFKLSTSAEAYDIEVISSKNKILSRAAIKTIQNLSSKFPSPNEELLLHVPITYKLSK